MTQEEYWGIDRANVAEENEMLISEKPKTLFSMDKALEYVEILTNGDEDGWSYKIIEHGKYGEIAVHDTDGTYLGSF
ncbi:hypothetical protein CMI37_29385 [Candidatus Pacearchaeota archaeon]|nr:hypothetical protein [Candidatus Pacearchaeota archaeon]|tara:strand:- start:47 stop:277 length:231 start_codon:yes stop_codon:yes gene_type:complete